MAEQVIETQGVEHPTGSKRRTFAEYLAILARWRKPIFIFTGIVLVSSSAVLWFFVPNIYESEAAIKSSSVTELSGSGLGSILDTKGLGSIGGILGIGSQKSDLDQDIGILQSKAVMSEVVKRFNLEKEYGTKYFDDAVKALSDNAKFGSDRQSQILTLAVDDTSPARAQKMCETFVSLLDSLNKELAQKNAQNSEDYLGIRYQQCVRDLGAAEDSLKLFQMRYKVYDMKDQATASIKVAADLEGDIMLKEAQANILAKSLGPNDADVKRAFDEVNELKRQRRQIDTGLDLSSAFQSIVPFAQAPQLGLEYFRRYRDVEIQEKLFALIYPLYEQAKVDVQRNTPTLLVLDAPSFPQKKTKPHRSIIVLIITVFTFFLAFLMALGIENIRRYSRLQPEQYRIFRESLAKMLPSFLIRWM
jgi:capsule polysaccharide export protein KpsE/RkpR